MFVVFFFAALTKNDRTLAVSPEGFTATNSFEHWTITNKQINPIKIDNVEFFLCGDIFANKISQSTKMSHHFECTFSHYCCCWCCRSSGFGFSFGFGFGFGCSVLHKLNVFISVWWATCDGHTLLIIFSWMWLCGWHFVNLC